MKAAKLAFAACLVSLAVTPAYAVRDTAQFTSLTVFGDSLVDAGNIFIATGGTTPNPALGYFQGRFTNGYDYTDLLSIALFGDPTTPSLAGGTNFAFGGARVVANTDVPPDLDAQLGLYQQRLTQDLAVDRNGLYVLNFGGNDIFNAQAEADARGITVPEYLTLAASEYADGVQALNDIGARNILVTGFPVLTDPNSFFAESLFLEELADLNLDGDTTLYSFSYLDFFNRLLTDPGSLGFDAPLIIEPSCLEAGAAPSCDGYFSFDGTHPVAAVHEALFRDMNSQFNLAAVPEPASWAMMIAGFGLVGAALRTRAKVALAAH